MAEQMPSSSKRVMTLPLTRVSVRTLGMRRSVPKRALFDESEENALILYEPIKRPATSWTRKEELVAVVVDPKVSSILSDYQRDGVKKIYDCLIEKRPAIIADQAGLGRRLQILAVMWTMLKQSPEGSPLIESALIITPTYLLETWNREIVNRLGDSVKVALVQKDAKLDEKLLQRAEIYIVVYEEVPAFKKFRKNRCSGGSIGMIVADFADLIISNDHQKFIDLISSFQCDRNVFMIRNRATDKQLKFMHEEAKFPGLTAKPMKLQRNPTVISKYLPERIDMLICCKLTGAQRDAYLNDEIALLQREKAVEKFALAVDTWNALRQICNYPEKDLNGELKVYNSGKLVFLLKLLLKIYKEGKDKVIVTSSVFGMFGLLKRILEKARFPMISIDNDMSPAKLLKVIDKFNAATKGRQFILLIENLTEGINYRVIGANRLILLESDIMMTRYLEKVSKIWTYGQTKTCYIYQIVMTGTLEERILTDLRTPNPEYGNEFNTLQALKPRSLDKLFKLNLEENLDSSIHQHLKCTRCVNGHEQRKPARPSTQEEANLCDFSLWHHATSRRAVPDNHLKPIMDEKMISFVFYKSTIEN